MSQNPSQKNSMEIRKHCRKRRKIREALKMADIHSIIKRLKMNDLWKNGKVNVKNKFFTCNFVPSAQSLQMLERRGD